MPLTDYVMMPGQDYQDACDAIRAKIGGTALIKSGDMAGEIESISGGGASYFEFSPTGDYQGANPYDALMLILNAVKAVKGDVPFYAWTPPVRNYIFQGILYYPASITQQKNPDVGWYAAVQRAEQINNVGHVFYQTFAGFDPVETTASFNKFPTSGRNASIQQADVYRAVDLSDIMLMSVPANATNLATPEETRMFAAMRNQEDLSSEEALGIILGGDTNEA